jgi:hypothetical protein
VELDEQVRVKEDGQDQWILVTDARRGGLTAAVCDGWRRHGEGKCAGSVIDGEWLW